MQHLGAFLADSSVPIPFNTRDASGAPITLAGTPLLRVKRADTLAVIADDLAPTVDVGSVTGQHLLVVDTSGAAYDGLTEFIVDVKQGTVDGASVAGEILRGFSITTGVLPDNAVSAGAVAAAAVIKVQAGLATAAALTTASAAASAAQTAAEGVQTQVGVAGAGLTALGDTRLTNLDAAVTTRAAPGDAMALTSAERTAIANEVETQIIDETDAEQVLTAITDKIASVNPDLGGLTVAAIASAVRTNLALELGRIDATVSSRATQAQVAAELATYDAPTLAEMTAALLTLATAAELALVKAKTDTIPASPAAVGSAMTLTAGERSSIATAILDAVYEGARTVRGFFRLAGSALWGKASGMTSGASAPIFRDEADTKARITAVTDATGNRTSVTTDDT